jgi:hypothetical protein
MTIKNETLHYLFKDFRDDDGLDGVVLIHAKENGKWLGVFRYELSKEQGNSKLVTKVAKLIPLDPSIAFDEQFKYEITYFSKELFPKSFSEGLTFSVSESMNVKLKGYYTQPKLDEHGKPILDEHGEMIIEKKPFETIN